jgi:hypothetical protein
MLQGVMLAFTRVFSGTAHSSRYTDPEPCEGPMKKMTRNQVVGAVLGMLKGQSVTANWNDYRFVLRPGLPAKPSALEYYDDESGNNLPSGILYLDHRSTVEENGRSKSHGFFKIVVKGRNGHNEEVTWDLKVNGEEDLNRWMGCLSAVCKTRWEVNSPECGVCSKSFGVTRTAHHCRYCGKCVCGECSPDVRTLSGLLPERVCTPCYEELGPSEGVLS